MISNIVAIIAVTGFFGLTIFQLLLAFGFPIGQAAWGGKYRILPVNLRIASFFSALLFVFVSISILEKVGLITIFNNQTLVNWVVWVFTAFLGLNTLSNLFGGSRLEKRYMAPVSLVLALLCLFISLTG
ncbi:MAG: hypothetical protein JSU58_07245 [Dehalococcoidales bacterium]|nr:MAG: hypothetical protein JSU58_07245 [Dehalococcoidales bacterium]